MIEGGSQTLRGVVTGESKAHEVVIRIDDSLLAHSLPGCVVHRVWSSGRMPTLPFDGAVDNTTSRLPSPGGVRVFFVEYPPVGGPMPPSRRAGNEPKVAPGAGGRIDFHTTDTVDIGFVISGEITLELEGESLTLTAGDALVQGGISHGWVNRSQHPCLMGFVILGAHRMSGSQ